MIPLTLAQLAEVASKDVELEISEGDEKAHWMS